MDIHAEKCMSVSTWYATKPRGKFPFLSRYHESKMYVFGDTYGDIKYLYMLFVFDSNVYLLEYMVHYTIKDLYICIYTSTRFCTPVLYCTIPNTSTNPLLV